MRNLLLALTLPLFLAGCISYTSTPAPPRSAVVAPSGSVVTCSDGTAPPCR